MSIPDKLDCEMYWVITWINQAYAYKAAIAVKVDKELARKCYFVLNDENFTKNFVEKETFTPIQFIKGLEIAQTHNLETISRVGYKRHNRVYRYPMDFI